MNNYPALPIGVQIVCKGYQQITKVAASKERVSSCFFGFSQSFFFYKCHMYVSVSNFVCVSFFFFFFLNSDVLLPMADLKVSLTFPSLVN